MPDTPAMEARFELWQPRPEGNTVIGRAATFEEANASALRIPNAEIYDRQEEEWVAVEPPDA